jgi:hypothetical protein
MNIVKIQNDLKDLSDRQLGDTMRSGGAPSYLVAAEMQRRQKMRAEAQSQPQQPSTVADELMQGIASNPAPNMQMAQGMYGGGIVGFKRGGMSGSAMAYQKGNAQACYTDPMTGKSDCPPAKPDVRNPKMYKQKEEKNPMLELLKSKRKKDETKGYAPGGMIGTDFEGLSVEEINQLLNLAKKSGNTEQVSRLEAAKRQASIPSGGDEYAGIDEAPAYKPYGLPSLFDPTERKAATMSRLERQQMEGGMTPEQIMATQERIAGGDYAGSKGYNLSEMAAYNADKMGDSWKGKDVIQEESRPNDPEGYAATATPVTPPDVSYPEAIRETKKEAETVVTPPAVSPTSQQGATTEAPDDENKFSPVETTEPVTPEALVQDQVSKKRSLSDMLSDNEFLLRMGIAMMTSQRGDFMGALGEGLMGGLQGEMLAREAAKEEEQARMLEEGRMERQRMAGASATEAAQIRGKYSLIGKLEAEATDIQEKMGETLDPAVKKALQDRLDSIQQRILELEGLPSTRKGKRIA